MHLDECTFQIADVLGIDKRIMRLLCLFTKAIDEISALNYSLVDHPSFDSPIINCTWSVYLALDDDRKKKVKQITVAAKERYDPAFAPHVKEWSISDHYEEDPPLKGMNRIHIWNYYSPKQEYETETLIVKEFYQRKNQVCRVRNLKTKRLEIKRFERLGDVEVLDCEELVILSDEPRHRLTSKLLEWYRQFKMVRVLDVYRLTDEYKRFRRECRINRSDPDPTGMDSFDLIFCV